MVAMNVWPTDASDGSVATEARWRKMARLWTPSGIDPTAGSLMVPSLAATNLTVRNGACWVDGAYCELLGDQVLTASANGLAVVRFDPAANTAELLYLIGATVPTQNPTGIWELPIASVTGAAMKDLRRLTTAPAGTLLKSGYATVTDVNTSAGGWYDLNVVEQATTYPYPTLTVVTGGGFGGFAGGGPAQFSMDVMALATSTAYGDGVAVWAQTAVYAGVPLGGSWVNAAGASVGFKVRVQFVSGSNLHTRGAFSWMIFAQ